MFWGGSPFQWTLSLGSRCPSSPVATGRASFCPDWPDSSSGLRAAFCASSGARAASHALRFAACFARLSGETKGIRAAERRGCAPQRDTGGILAYIRRRQAQHPEAGSGQRAGPTGRSPQKTAQRAAQAAGRANGPDRAKATDSFFLHLHQSFMSLHQSNHHKWPRLFGQKRPSPELPRCRNLPCWSIQSCVVCY